MKRVGWIALGLLTGCVSLPDQLNAELQPYVGHNVSELVSRLGYPDSKREMLGDTLYAWSTSRHMTMTLPSSTQTTGEVGGTPFSATTQGTEDVHMHFHCVLTIATDAAGVIKNYRWDGNGGGCKHFADALEH